MSFEAEVLPMFIGGCGLVSIMELAVGWAFLNRQRRAMAYFTAHVFSMGVALWFLVKCLFGSRLGFVPGIESISNSVNVGLFGLLWFASVMLMLAAINELAK